MLDKVTSKTCSILASSAVSSTRIHIVGYGRAGKALAMSLANAGFQPQVLKRGDSLSPVKDADVVFLAVPDRVLQSIFAKLADFPTLPGYVAYLSGALPLGIAEPIQNRASILQFHPLVSMLGDKAIPAGSFVGICASNEATKKTFFDLATSLRLNPFELQDGNQATYHAAAAFAANLPVALFYDAAKLFQKAGLEDNTARLALAKLIESVANNLEAHSMDQILTGPAKRGDVVTMESHAQSIASHGDAAMLRRYLELSKRITEIANHVSLF